MIDLHLRERGSEQKEKQSHVKSKQVIVVSQLCVNKERPPFVFVAHDAENALFTSLRIPI